MKTIGTLLGLILFAAIAEASPKVVLSPVDHLFIPHGFDNNDNVEVIVTGKFPNPCFAKNKVNVDIKGEEIIVTVTALMREVGIGCPDIPVPFKEEITLGNLQGGDYKVSINKNSRYELKEKMNIAVSSSSGVDDHYYAVSEYIDFGFTGGASGHALLIANSPNSCLKFDRVEYLSNKKDTISVLPILKRIPGPCAEVTERLEIDLNYDISKLKSEKILLFVRSMEGKSINGLILR